MPKAGEKSLKTGREIRRISLEEIAIKLIAHFPTCNNVRQQTVDYCLLLQGKLLFT